MLGITAGVMLVASCSRTQKPTSGGNGEPDLSKSYEYMMAEVDGQMRDLRMLDNQPSSGLSNEKVALGRVLFYDKKLSINNTVACGNCHQQQFAFCDQQALSDGFANKKTLRNSMSIQNVILNNSMFWDSRAGSPGEMSLNPVFNHIEMGIEDDAMLVSKVANASYYPSLFKKAFGSESITREKIGEAMTSFLVTTFSQQSKFDQGKRNDFKNFTDLEKIGKDLFFSSELKCSQCHSGENFMAPDGMGGGYGSPTVKGTANIGLEKVPVDKGKNNGSFKIPSLRNIALTGPYMHDGRFATLEDVLNHYSEGIQANANLDSKLKDGNGKPLKMNLDVVQKQALIAFLNTLTDENLIKNEKFSNPFRN
jgi:cytochrome c peroxidase